MTFRKTPDKLEVLNINIYLLLSFVALANFFQVCCRLSWLRINDTIVIPIQYHFVTLLLPRLLNFPLNDSLSVPVT